jgi:hypothetical protein
MYLNRKLIVTNQLCNILVLLHGALCMQSNTKNYLTAIKMYII